MKDKIFFWRAQNALLLQEKLDVLLEQRQITSPTAIPLRLAIPFLEKATLEDDETLQERWSRLLVNAMDPSFTAGMERSFCSILEDLSPHDCLALEKLKKLSDNEAKVEITPQLLAEIPSKVDSMNVIFGNLLRLGLIAQKPKTGGPIGSIRSWVFENSAFYLTALGGKFLSACAKETPNT